MSAQVAPTSVMPMSGMRIAQPGAAAPTPREIPLPQGRSETSPVAETDTADAVTQAIMRGAEQFTEGREVAVDNRYDEATGRAVYRVADRRTGEILFESPPEPLLRFFASMREPPGAPLVALDA